MEVFEPLRGLVVPPEGFLAQVPCFGTHGIREENVNGFLKNFTERGVGKGHFFFLTDDCKILSSDKFDLMFRASLGLNIGNSVSNRYRLADSGNIVFQSHPVVILAIANPNISLFAGRSSLEEFYVWNPLSQEFRLMKSETLRKNEDVVAGKFLNVEPFVFDDKDVKELNLAWKDYLGGRTAGSKQEASIFTEYYIYQKLAGRILSRLAKEIEARKQQPGLPKVK